MKRFVTPMLPLALLLLTGDVAVARGRPVPRPRASRPKLLFTVEKVEASTPAPRVEATLREALDKALAAEPLVITGLGLKKPTPARTAWELRRRGLRWFGVTARLESVTHRVVIEGGEKRLVAEAVVRLAGTRRERFRKGTFAARGTGRSATPVSVVLHGEVLASRLAATRAAVGHALRDAVTQLTGPRRPAPRRLRR
jgi:hypothetical protein